MQYGGSQAHSTVFEKERGDWELFSRIKDKLTSFRRFMANSYTDADKQDAINLFLGNFVPSRSSAPLWDLDSDAYLHSGTAAVWHHSPLQHHARCTKNLSYLAAVEVPILGKP